MIYGFLAACVALIHIAFVAFVVVGGLLLYRWQWLAWLHVPSALYGVLIMVIGWRCPLTDLEIWLRQQAGEVVQWKEFLHHYIWQHLGWTGSEWFIVAGLVVAIAVFNWRPYQVILG